MKDEITKLIASFLHGEEFVLQPKKSKLVPGLGNEKFEMYFLHFAKLESIENESDIYICQCQNLAQNCLCLHS